MTEKVEGIVLMPEPSRESLNDHQLVDYRDHRQKFVKWALNMGKDPKHADGYAHSTVRQRAYRLDKFYRAKVVPQKVYCFPIIQANSVYQRILVIACSFAHIPGRFRRSSKILA
jgi:hypothetical protein